MSKIRKKITEAAKEVSGEQYLNIKEKKVN